VEVDDYDVSKNLHDAPAFVWWVPYVLKKRNRIISATTIYTTRGPTTLGLKSLRVEMTVSYWTKRTATIFDRMQ
jgi:hypothetical protein